MIGLVKDIISKLRTSTNTAEKKLANNYAANKARVPLTLLHGLSNEEVLSVFLNRDNISPSLQEIIPSLPSDRMQQNWTGASGRVTLLEAMNFYQIVCEMVEKHSAKIDCDSKILDFGCGWGRIIRFFLKDVSHDNLYGTDCYAEALDTARNQNKWCNFELSKTTPPLNYDSAMFDVIYLYSVFSHLSEEMHLKWVEEFNRILKPGGMLIATTRSKEFINYCQKFKDKKVLEHQIGLTVSFEDTEHYLKLYENGGFCHSPTGGGGPLDSSFYGETCISEQYVKCNWNKWFQLAEYRYADDKCNQNVICCRKY